MLDPPGAALLKVRNQLHQLRRPLLHRISASALLQWKKRRHAVPSRIPETRGDVQHASEQITDVLWQRYHS